MSLSRYGLLTGAGFRFKASETDTRQDICLVPSRVEPALLWSCKHRSFGMCPRWSGCSAAQDWMTKRLLEPDLRQGGLKLKCWGSGARQMLLLKTSETTGCVCQALGLSTGQVHSENFCSCHHGGLALTRGIQIEELSPFSLVTKRQKHMYGSILLGIAPCFSGWTRHLCFTAHCSKGLGYVRRIDSPR